MAQIRLSDGEWKLMKTLWEKQPRTLAELVSALDKDTGWRPGNDLYDAQATHCQGRGHDGRQWKISEIQRSDHLF